MRALKPLSPLLALALALPTALLSCTTEDAGTTPGPCPTGFTRQGERCVTATPVEIQPPQIGPARLDRGFIVQLVATGGQEPYRFEVTEGELPPELTLSESGEITGTATETGTWDFTVRATGADDATGEIRYSLQVTTELTCSPSESCDGVDNDCDGITDETVPGIGEPCGPDVPDVCVRGTTACLDGGIRCQGAVTPREEVCDQSDNDCDGQADEGSVCEGECAAQPCAPGSVECVSDAASHTCEADANGCGVWSAEVACGAACQAGTCEPCEDADGDLHGRGCVAGNDCNEEDPTIYRRASELCDATDNDCDGAVDEGNACTINCGPDACAPGFTRCSDPNTLQVCERVEGCGVWGATTRCEQGCDGGRCLGCTDADRDQHGEGCPEGPDCDETNPFVYEGAPERCDGVDNDCDDRIDDGNVCDEDRCVEDDLEDNDRPSDASSLPEGASLPAIVCGLGNTLDRDWFELGTYPPGGTIRLHLEFGTPGCQLHMELFNGPASVATTQPTEGPQDLTFTAIIPGPHRVLIVPDANPTRGCPYVITHE